MTQSDEVLHLLSEGWVCGTTFLNCCIPRYPARILELRRQGFPIERRRCEHPLHFHRSTQYEWRLAP